MVQTDSPPDLFTLPNFKSWPELIHLVAAMCDRFPSSPLDVLDLKHKVRELDQLHQVSTVVIEDSSSGSQLIQELRCEGFAKIQAIKPGGSKYERIVSCTAKIEAGKVWLPEQAHWLEAFKHELELFPNAKYDDQADAFSQGLRWISDSSGPAYFLWMMDEVERRRREGP